MTEQSHGTRRLLQDVLSILAWKSRWCRNHDRPLWCGVVSSCEPLRGLRKLLEDELNLSGGFRERHTEAAGSLWEFT